MNTLEQKMNDAIWIAKELFDRGKATGSQDKLKFLMTVAYYRKWHLLRKSDH